MTAAGHCYVMLGTINFVDKSVNDNSARRLDHCDVITSRSGFGLPTGVPHSEIELQTEFKSFTAAHLGSNTNQHRDWTLGGTCIKFSRSVYAPHLVQSVRLLLFKYRGVTMLTGFPRTRWPRPQFSESYAIRISVKISRICEFRVIMGIMTGLLGCCSSSTVGNRANDYVKTLATPGFWLHHSSCSLGCWTNNTLAARSLSPQHVYRMTAIEKLLKRCWIISSDCLIRIIQRKEIIRTPGHWPGIFSFWTFCGTDMF